MHSWRGEPIKSSYSLLSNLPLGFLPMKQTQPEARGKEQESVRSIKISLLGQRSRWRMLKEASRGAMQDTQHNPTAASFPFYFAGNSCWLFTIPWLVNQGCPKAQSLNLFPIYCHSPWDFIQTPGFKCKIDLYTTNSQSISLAPTLPLNSGLANPTIYLTLTRMLNRHP